MRHRSPQPHERFTPYGGPISPRSPSSPRAPSGHYFRSPSSSPSLSNSVLSGSMSTSPSYMPSLSVLRPPSIQTSGSPSSYPHPYPDGPQYQQHLSPQSAAFPSESEFSRSFTSELSPTSPTSTRRSFSHSSMPQPYPSWKEVPYSSDWSPPGRDHPHAQPSQPPHALPPQLRMHPPFATSNQYPHHISEPQGVRPTRRRRRPTVSYSNIIITAIRNSPQQRLRLSEIYEYVSREIPQMMGDDKGWQVRKTKAKKKRRKIKKDLFVTLLHPKQISRCNAVPFFLPFLAFFVVVIFTHPAFFFFPSFLRSSFYLLSLSV